METQRHIGIDLHRNQFTCCVRLENGRNYLTDWKLEDLRRIRSRAPKPVSTAISSMDNRLCSSRSLAASIRKASTALAGDTPVSARNRRVNCLGLRHATHASSAMLRGERKWNFA